MTIKNGDLPAMPVCYDARMMAAYSKGEAMGLSKREQFAAMAMQGLLVKDDVNINNVARLAVDVADRLLAQLENYK